MTISFVDDSNKGYVSKTLYSRNVLPHTVDCGVKDGFLTINLDFIAFGDQCFCGKGAVFSLRGRDKLVAECILCTITNRVREILMEIHLRGCVMESLIVMMVLRGFMAAVM